MISLENSVNGECWELVTCKKCGYKIPAPAIRTETELYIDVDKINFCPLCGASMREYLKSNETDIIMRAVRAISKCWLPECMRCPSKVKCHYEETKVYRGSEECLNNAAKYFQKIVRKYETDREKNGEDLREDEDEESEDKE